MSDICDNTREQNIKWNAIKRFKMTKGLVLLTKQLYAYAIGLKGRTMMRMGAFIQAHTCWTDNNKFLVGQEAEKHGEELCTKSWDYCLQELIPSVVFCNLELSFDNIAKFNPDFPPQIKEGGREVQTGCFRRTND